MGLTCKKNAARFDPDTRISSWNQTSGQAGNNYPDVQFEVSDSEFTVSEDITIATNEAASSGEGKGDISSSLFVVKEAPETLLEASFLEVDPVLDIQTGRLDSARVRYHLAESYESRADTALVLTVNLGSELLETVPLFASSQLEPDGIIGDLEYVPTQGWESGTMKTTDKPRARLRDEDAIGGRILTMSANGIMA